jgi:hypothetical protein
MNGPKLIPFEIHITADESIHKTAKPLGLKTIAVDLLTPILSIMRTEHMTSHVQQFENEIDCGRFVIQTAKKLEDAGSKLIRIKIECPYIESMVEKSIYLESHWHTPQPTGFPLSTNITERPKYPLSRSQHKPNVILATARTYDKAEYEGFREQNWGSRQVVELALYDTFIEEDFDWFQLYE